MKFEYTFVIYGYVETEESDVKWGNDREEDDFKRLDMGLAIGAGLEIKSIQLGIIYGLGLVNITPYADNGARC